jgi:hypothetical protein
MRKLNIARTVTIVILATMLTAACAKREPFEYRSNLEVPDGRGLLSGDRGGLILF